MYRIKYWLQETTESGKWCLTGTMPRLNAEKIVESQIYERAECFPDEEYKICKNCAFIYIPGKECMKHNARKVSLQDLCNDWHDSK